MRIVLCLLALLLGGCATLQSDRLSPTAFPKPVELAQVPFFPQEEYQCGPAALATTLNWIGITVTPDGLSPQLYVPDRKGTFQLELLAAARRHGAIPYVLNPEFQTLLTEVQAGNPVLVLQNLGVSWYPKWHYAVVVGFDAMEQELVLRSGRELRHRVSFSTFERTWRRGEYWAIVTSKPGHMPETAEELPMLQAVTGLERVKRHTEASTAYAYMLTRWPDSLGALLGLGNSRYALHDKIGAERAFRQAVEKHDSSADAHNNLAHVLAERGQWQEAETHARQAVALGGPRLTTYQQTLDDILARKR